MKEEMFLSDLLIHNILLARDYEELMRTKADISDGLCAIDLAISEVCTDRVKEMLYTAKDLLTSYHFLLDMMAVDKPKIK